MNIQNIVILLLCNVDKLLLIIKLSTKKAIFELKFVVKDDVQ